MTTILQPKVADSQQLIRAADACNVQRMVASLEKEKAEFARRFRAALDCAGVKDDRQRRGRISKEFRVSVETARKWLSGESIPATKRIPSIADWLGVRGEWLLTGQGQMEAAGTAAGAVQMPPLAGRADVVDVPVMNAAGSMGGGLLAPEHDAIVDHMRLATEWIRRNLTAVSRPANLAVLTAYGDSMTPTFNSGDMLLVDTGVADLKLDAVYVLDRDGELFIKRVQRRMDGALVIRSDNPLYESFVMQESELARLRVLGRVVWAWNGKSL